MLGAYIHNYPRSSLDHGCSEHIFIDDMGVYVCVCVGGGEGLMSFEEFQDGRHASWILERNYFNNSEFPRSHNASQHVLAQSDLRVWR